jgi:drug/metabolite transporter (DMT)-like permease
MIDGTVALLASAFLHAAWNGLLKRERDPQVAVLGVLAAALALAAIGALTMPGAGFPGRSSLAWTIAAGLFEGAYFVTLAAALARATYGAVYAIARGGALLLVWPAAALLLGEPATPRGALGALVVGLGVALVAQAGRERITGTGIAWALGSAASIAGYHLCYDRALAEGAAPAPVFAVALAVALPLVWGSVRIRGGMVRPAWPATGRWALAGLLCTGSFLLFLAGLARSGAGPALTLRSTSVVIAQGLAMGMGEPVLRRQLLGATLVVAGAAALAWP